MRFSNFLVQFFSDSKKILIRELQEIREFLIWRKKEAELKILIILRQPPFFINELKFVNSCQTQFKNKSYIFIIC